MSEDMHEKGPKKAAIVGLISLKREAENKSREELKTEIREALEKGLAKLPWVIVNNVVVVEELS